MAIAPKVLKSLKRRAALKRKRPIRAKGKFKAHGDNPFKSYRRKRTDAQVMEHALKCRAERLANRTKAEIMLSEALDRHGILYESEKIFLNGDRHIAVDFYIKSAVLAIEVDGSSHDTQESYDKGRDAWLLHSYGVRTIRIPNAMVFKRPHEALAMVTQSLHKGTQERHNRSLPRCIGL